MMGKQLPEDTATAAITAMEKAAAAKLRRKEHKRAARQTKQSDKQYKQSKTQKQRG